MAVHFQIPKIKSFAFSFLLVFGIFYFPNFLFSEESQVPDESELENLVSKEEFNTQSFLDAKKILKRIYKNGGEEFYCGCSFTKEKRKFLLDTSSCGLESRNDPIRFDRIEWEHVVPAHAFGNSRTCWREKLCTKNGRSFKGRKCCVEIDPVFRAMEGDMHNLQPSAGELNKDRNVYSFGIVEGEPREYGACDFELDRSTNTVEPREEIRGVIARTYFYMEDRYKVRISDQKRKLFTAWDKQFPASDWEKKRNRLIAKHQGNKNSFIPE